MKKSSKKRPLSTCLPFTSIRLLIWILKRCQFHYPKKELNPWIVEPSQCIQSTMKSWIISGNKSNSSGANWPLTKNSSTTTRPTCPKSAGSVHKVLLVSTVVPSETLQKTTSPPKNLMLLQSPQSTQEKNHKPLLPPQTKFLKLPALKPGKNKFLPAVSEKSKT